jgi:AbrB family looped-hinge helix DNA binding protein
MATLIQMRKRGSITIPMNIRKKYHLDENDPLTLIDLGEGIYLSPKQSVLPKLASEIDKLRKKHNLSLEELIDGVYKERNE